MCHEHAARLFDEAATAGLRITGLDGWTQTRLAGSLKIRREVVNAIINRDPVAAPSDSRPRMVEACRKIIAFAAVISRKDDSVVPREVDLTARLDDDAQAYESHKLHLRRIVEDAAAGGAFIEGMYRVGELSSQAIYAPPRFRVQMIGNVVTAIQRLLDKPQSRSIPVDMVAHNLRRLTLAEWAARRAVLATPAGERRAKAADDRAYIRGQVGYAMIFSGLLGRDDKAVRRGRRRLWRAARVQPGPDCGHWSNLLRALNDLIASDHLPARDWAARVVDLADKQRHPGFALAMGRLRENGELATLLTFWAGSGAMKRVNAILARGTSSTGEATAPRSAQSAAPRRRQRKGSTAAAILLLVGLLMAPSAARGGDGKELATRGGPPQRVVGGTVSRAAPVAPGTVGNGGSVRGGAGSSGSIASPRNGSVASDYPARYGATSSPRTGAYPNRETTSAPGAADSATRAGGGFATPARLARRASAPAVGAGRDRERDEVDLDQIEAELASLLRFVAGDETLNDARGQSADAVQVPKKASRPAPRAAGSNRLPPLAVIDDFQAPTRSRPFRLQRPSRDEAEAMESDENSPPVVSAIEAELPRAGERRS